MRRAWRWRWPARASGCGNVADRRVFFALWPSERQREELRDTVKAAVSTVEGRAVDRSNWHVTLLFVGEFPEAKLAALHEAAEAVRVAPFRMRFDRLEFWARPRLACLTATAVAPELQALVDDLGAAVEPLGVEPERRTFRPHITVVRRARAFTAEPLAQPVTLEWSGFELVESVSGTRGVQYRPLKQELLRDS